MLTIVTASHRNLAGLQALRTQLLGALDEGLQWVIQDSGACLSTRQWAASLDDPAISFRADGDSGIYDALNRALQRVRTPFYLVAGSDDSLDAQAVRAIAAGLANWPGDAETRGLAPGCSKAPPPTPPLLPDVLTFPVVIDGRIRQRQRWWPDQVNVSGLTASHSVGTVIRLGLHDRLGGYDTRYRILADSLFLRRAQLAGARFDHRPGPVPGSFSTGGVSRRDHGRIMVENYRYNIECGSSRLLQSLMFLLRFCVYRPRSFH